MGQKNKRIVVMEDSRALLKGLIRMLENQGYEVEGATNGEEGVQKVDALRPSLVLTDIMMPVMDGFEVVTYIKKRFPKMPVIAFSAQPQHVVGDRITNAGADMFLQKPLREPILLKIVEKYTASAEDSVVQEEVKYLAAEEDQPYLVQLKSCYICAYDGVNVFVPRPGSWNEDWTNGLFPVYKPAEGFSKWDFLKTTVSVCPSCFFASMDPNDFARNADDEFPYKSDAKKVLSRAIGTRKRLIDSHKKAMDMKFTNPNRTHDLVIASFLLAEKCGNGLVMGEKQGIYSHMGYYQLMQAVLEFAQTRDKTDFHAGMRQALGNFLNQLKVRNTPRESMVRSYYFIIALHMALGESGAANEQMNNLERFYEIHNAEDASDTERMWNNRLLHIWQEGIEAYAIREVH